MANTVKHKRSNVASTVPTTSQVAIGELAINFVDKKIFTQEPGGTIIELGGSSSASAYQVFTASGTWTKPSSGTFAKITVVGSGAGGATANGPSNAGGGLGGDVVCAIIPLSSLGATETVTIGAAGAGAAAATTAGANGAACSFGTHVIAAGGAGGATGNVGNIAYTGTASAVATGTPELSTTGLFSAYGGDKIASATAPASGYSNVIGKGGNSNNAGAGSVGSGYGSGGGAGTTTGGAGKTGIVIVEVY